MDIPLAIFLRILSMEQYSLPISSLRQMAFCPRIPYFTQILGLIVKYPIWTSQGIEFHKSMETLVRRRDLARYQLNNAKQVFSANVSSSKLKLHGTADLILITDADVFPVEFKRNMSLTKGTIAQLIAYGLAAEDTYKKSFNIGFVFGSGHNKVKVIERNKDNLAVFERYYGDLTHMMDSGIFPDSPASVNQCTQCEFLKHCNDR